MKNFTSFIVIFLVVFTINAQTPSNCSIQTVFKDYYDADIKHLALERIYDQYSNYTDSIEIPYIFQDTIWRGMAAIFNLTSLPERDSVFDNYCIHQFGGYIYHGIYVNIDTSYDWTIQWQNQNTVTGIAELDTLLATYGFTVTNYWSNSNTAILYTNQNLNILPLCDSLKFFEGVNYAEPIPYGGSGNSIKYDKIGNDRVYEFTIGYGDCPMGCSGWRTYKFKVYEDCAVEYLGTENHVDPLYPFPSPPNCNITTSIKVFNSQKGFKVYPNPVRTQITIESTNLIRNKFCIINLYGQLLITGEFRQEKRISIENLPIGIYFIKFNNNSNDGFVSYKFVKE